MASKKPDKPESRISPALARALGSGDGAYELSSAFSGPELRRLHGDWEVVEHRVEGRPYLEAFRARTIKALILEAARYEALYSFKEALCVKRVSIEGPLDLPEGELAYRYHMGMALSWGILPGGFLRVRPELGYHSSFLGDSPAAAGELAVSGQDIVIRYRFEADDLVLEEGSDFKRLRRRP